MDKTLASVFCNAALAVITFFAVLSAMRQNAALEGKRAAAFRYFTTDSNILSGAAALAVALFDLRLLASGAALPSWVLLLKFAGTASVAVTFFTVLFFLGPTQGYKEMFASNGLFLHLICPLLAILSLCALDPGPKLTLWQASIGGLPLMIYSALYFAMVVVIGERNGGWEDFYGFDRNGKWPVSMALMLVATYAICALLCLAYNAIH